MMTAQSESPHDSTARFEGQQDVGSNTVLVEELIFDEMPLFSGVGMDEMFLVQHHPARSRSYQRDNRFHAPTGIRSRTGSHDAQIATGFVEKCHRESVETR